MKIRRHLTVVAILGALLAAQAAVSAHAQTGDPQGRISGELVLGTDGATLGEDLMVDFIVLVGSEIGGTIPATVEGTRFSVQVPLDTTRRYIGRAVYQGVSYLGAPVAVTEAEPEVVVELPSLYETTTETPELSIGETVVTAVALDRTTGEIGLIREDLVVNATDRVYLGASGVTLRLPTPERTTDALGENVDGEFVLQDGILTTTTPIRARGSTSIVTRYLVTYDVTDDEYVLRVTTPLPTGRLVVRVPESYVRSAEVVGAGAEGDGELFEVADGDDVPLRTFILENAAPGDSLVVRLEGLALVRNHNPIAETPGSLIAGAVALVVIGGAAAFVVIRGRERTA
ncbi:MAG: hypothetical protein DWG80_00285 [Chloroflexi bacterium]|nr:hypothetical protein [Chloroflexota bacterium]